MPPYRFPPDGIHTHCRLGIGDRLRYRPFLQFFRIVLLGLAQGGYVFGVLAVEQGVAQLAVDGFPQAEIGSLEALVDEDAQGVVVDFFNVRRGLDDAACHDRLGSLCKAFAAEVVDEEKRIETGDATERIDGDGAAFPVSFDRGLGVVPSVLVLSLLKLA